MDKAFADRLNAELTPLPWQQRLAALCGQSRAAFSTSFSPEDQAITHIIAAEKLPTRIFTLDTGRLFEQVQALHQRTRETYGIVIETYVPDAGLLEAYVNSNGVNAFYNSHELRLECCHIRKVEPLARALRNTDIWISGLRNEHSAARAQLPVVEWDESRGVVKCQPLADVTEAALWEFIKRENIPYNPMYEEGYPSIGCAPCTRAVAAGEHPRSGRWWWEEQTAQECGLHLKDGKLVRGGAAHA